MNALNAAFAFVERGDEYRRRIGREKEKMKKRESERKQK